MEEEEVKNLILLDYHELFAMDNLYSIISSNIDHFSCCFQTDEEKKKASVSLYLMMK